MQVPFFMWVKRTWKEKQVIIQALSISEVPANVQRRPLVLLGSRNTTRLTAIFWKAPTPCSLQNHSVQWTNSYKRWQHLWEELGAFSVATAPGTEHTAESWDPWQYWVRLGKSWSSNSFCLQLSSAFHLLCFTFCSKNLPLSFSFSCISPLH